MLQVFAAVIMTIGAVIGLRSSDPSLGSMMAVAAFLIWCTCLRDFLSWKRRRYLANGGNQGTKLPMT